MATFCPTNNTMFITFQGDSQNPYYCVFDCKNNLTTIPPTTFPLPNSGSASRIFSTWISKSNKIFISWDALPENGGVMYGIYDVDNNTFSQPPTAYASSFKDGMYPAADVIPCYQPSLNQVVVTWAGSNSNYYAIFDVSSNQFIGAPAIIPGSENNNSRNNVMPVYYKKNNSVVMSWSKDDGIGVFLFLHHKKSAINSHFKIQDPVFYQK